MKLTKVRVQNYRSVEDSEEFEIGDLTCLVGKNEAGKTTLLSAMRGLRPSQPFEFDEVIDYPRRFSTRFDDRHEDGTAEVIRTWWRHDDADKAAVEKRFGAGVLKGDTFQSHFGFRYEDDRRIWTIDVDSAKVTNDALISAAPTPRIVKKAEALFKLMPATVAEFDHFGASRWLLENPSILDADTPAVNATLDRFEEVFKAFNALLA